MKDARAIKEAGDKIREANKEIVGRIIINIPKGGDFVIEFEGDVDPGNLQSLKYHVQMQYERKYRQMKRDLEVENAEELKLIAEEKDREKAQKAKELQELKDAETIKKKEEEIEKTKNEAKKQLELNKIIEAERIIEKAKAEDSEGNREEAEAIIVAAKEELAKLGEATNDNEE